MRSRKPDPTLIQMRKQLAAFGCERFEVQALPPVDRKDLRPLGIRTLTGQQAVDQLGFLKSVNARGYDVYVRPAPREDGLAEPFAFVDDVIELTVNAMKNDGFPFAILIESSPGNFHGWIKLADNPLPRDVLTECARQLAEKYGGDPNSADWRHYGRLAGFTNQKRKHRNAQGYQPYAKLKSSSTKIAPAGADLIEAARQQLSRNRVAEQEARKQREQARQRPSSRQPPFSRQTAFTPTADPVEAFRQEMEKRPGGDQSSEDFFIALKLLQRGYSHAQVRDALREASPGIEERHRDVNYYVNRTTDFSFAVHRLQQGYDPEDVEADLLEARPDLDISDPKTRSYITSTINRAERNVLKHGKTANTTTAPPTGRVVSRPTCFSSPFVSPFQRQPEKGEAGRCPSP